MKKKSGIRREIRGFLTENFSLHEYEIREFVLIRDFNSPSGSYKNVLFEGKQMILRTIEKANDFSSLRISYTRLIGTIEERRKDLMEQYYFLCNCSKCQDIESDQLKSSLICPGNN